MINIKHILILMTLWFFPSLTWAGPKICSFAFNSTNERDALYQELRPLGATLVEIVPSNHQNSNWFQDACKKIHDCDITVFSGHFGGLFFGEESTITLSMDELLQAKANGSCKGIIERPKSVYLMGCNTLASKTKDHRSINEYLNVLLHDGFPLDLSERVASARYLNYGESNEEIMTSIFSNNQTIIGFESTGPLGRVAGPLIKKAIRNSSYQDKTQFGASSSALRSAFRSTSIKIKKSTQTSQTNLKEQALSQNTSTSQRAWSQMISSYNLDQYISFIVDHSYNSNLIKVLNLNPKGLEKIMNLLVSKIRLANGLASIQLKMLHFLYQYNLMSQPIYFESFKNFTLPLTYKKIDFLSASQLCSIFNQYPKETQYMEQRGHFSNLSSNFAGEYSNYLYRCRNKNSARDYSDPAGRCLTNRDQYDWGCLTSNPNRLEVSSCLLAAKRNTNPSNSDDMLWFCYDKMKSNRQLSRPLCLELSDGFKILGNQIKMNWNCLNRI